MKLVTPLQNRVRSKMELPCMSPPHSGRTFLPTATCDFSKSDRDYLRGCAAQGSPVCLGGSSQGIAHAEETVVRTILKQADS